jgi:DMSO/TMAO reductase YedYZ molybdopterin-dependent catalytic subunit
MRHPQLVKAGTGLAVGALLTAPLLAVFALGSLAGLPSVPFTVFEWLIRVLPGRLVIFGLELTVRILQGLGFNIKNTAKTAEQVLALGSLFVGGLVIALLFFLLVRTADRQRIRRYALGIGAAVGIFSLVLTLLESAPTGITGKIVASIWTLGLFLVWGAALARLYRFTFPQPEAAPAGPARRKAKARVKTAGEPATAVQPQAEARAISRRRFIIEMGGLVATVVVVGAGVGEVLRAQTATAPQVVKAPIPFPNAGSAIQPVPGTRPEYTAVADHYRIDIDLTAPSVDGTSWRLPIEGLVANKLSLSLDQLKTGFAPQQLFITLSCISNPLGGPLIGTTLWTGVPFRDILRQAQPLPNARYAHITAADGFDEVVDLEMVNADSRIMLTYAWNGEPLPRDHGYPLRIYIPDIHGMKQPKWITGINLVPDFIAGYWVARGWDKTARMHTTSVIDTVATDSLQMKNGQTYVPIGGIAHAGARGISKVEVQVDGGAWEPAELRAPLSGLTWVLWRYDWPFSEGVHEFAVRATDGQGNLQETQKQGTFPSGATGIYTKGANVLPPLK